MTNRLPDKELQNYEDTIANALHIQHCIKRVVYLIDDPDALSELVDIAATAARIRRITLQELARRKGRNGTEQE